jgi:COP9 signalosome complex subunit 6
MEVDDNRDEAMGDELDSSLADSSSVSSLNPIGQFVPEPSAASSSNPAAVSVPDRASKISLAPGGQVMASNGSQGSVTVALHPLVIMNISDHWTRVKAQEKAEKKGTLRLAI